MTLLALVRALLIPKAELAAENLALRQQIAVLKRSVSWSRFRARDRIIWVLLRRLWAGWRGAVGFVQSATVVAWHRMRRPKADLDRALRMSAEGMTVSAIARILGTSPSTVSHWLDKARPNAREFSDEQDEVIAGERLDGLLGGRLRAA